MEQQGDPVRVGVDIGGTFTDLVSIQDGQIDVVKTPSTPNAPEDGVIDSLDQLSADAAVDLSTVGFFGHGATLTTNAVLEGDWAKAALLTTEGCRDILEIRRQARPDLYDLQAEKPTPFIERDTRFGITERIDERGEVITPLNESQVRDVARRIEGSDIESIAVCLLFSFENGSNEERVREILNEECGEDVPISLSSDVLPEIREYERSQTTALNAVLQPVLDDYLDRLTDAIDDREISAPLRIMQSNGGIITTENARETPVNTCLSGPAAGVQGATYVSDHCGIDDIITMDMGGTSCDVSLVEGGEPVISTEGTVGEYSVSVPMIDIHTIGSGGGSIAWIDAGGALRVGPQSAGANPGPVCYGRGGTEPTVTDAHLLLGRIDPTRFSIDFNTAVEKVHDSMEREIADPLGITVDEAAQGILDVANASMERALRVVSVERGYDPREFGLIAYGGAGPLHACKLASELDIPTVLVPNSAGVLSAFGLVVSDVLYDYSTSRIRPWADIDVEYLNGKFEEFIAGGRDQLASAGLIEEDMMFERFVDLRYEGQSYSIRVALPDEPLVDETIERIADLFHERHEQRYGHSSWEESIELVTIRLRARGTVEQPNLATTVGAASLEDAIRGTRTVTFEEDTFDTRIYDRSELPADCEFDGPAIVENDDSTTVIYPQQSVQVDNQRNLTVEVEP